MRYLRTRQFPGDLENLGFMFASATGHRRAAAGGGIPLILGYQKSGAAPTDCYADILDVRTVFWSPGIWVDPTGSANPLRPINHVRQRGRLSGRL